jgi:hypothetical protein
MTVKKDPRCEGNSVPHSCSTESLNIGTSAKKNPPNFAISTILQVRRVRRVQSHQNPAQTLTVETRFVQCNVLGCNCEGGRKLGDSSL